MAKVIPAEQSYTVPDHNKVVVQLREKNGRVKASYDITWYVKKGDLIKILVK